LRRGEAADAAGSVGYSVENCVVADHRDTVLRPHDIRLDETDSGVHRRPKSARGVFGYVEVQTAVSEHARSGSREEGVFGGTKRHVGTVSRHASVIVSNP
jgi:hypothetical protein